MQILCCGNRHRGDDAAGPLVADRLQELGITAQILNGEATEIMEAWSGADSVVLVDAVMTGASPGTIHVWNGDDLSLRNISSASTHGLGVGEAIELGRALGRLPGKLQVYGIEGTQFAAGTSASPAVEQAAAEMARRIADLVGLHSPPHKSCCG